MASQRTSRFQLILIAGSIAAMAPAQRAAAGPLQARLRILDHNVFGRASDFCEDRARGFGKIVANASPPFDIVGIQEYYHNPDFNIATCDSDHLGAGIHCTGRYGNSYAFYPEGGPLFDGGIAVFSMGSICEFGEWQWSYQDFGAVQGVILARIEVPGTTVTLDVYVLHLHGFVDGCDRCCRRRQLEELAAIIQANSADSGNPVLVMGDFNIGGPPTCCGNEGYDDITSILGNPRDLWWEHNHCEASPDGCSLQSDACDGQPVNDCTSPPDCAGTPPPVTENCTHPIPQGGCFPADCSIVGPASCNTWSGATNNSCLNELGDGNERIDYIFLVTDPALSSSAFDVQTVDAMVANWVVLHQPPPNCFGCPYPDCSIPKECTSPDCFANGDCLCATCSCFECDPEYPPPIATHVSDHLGVEVTIDIFGLSSVWVDALYAKRGTGTSCDPFSTLADAVSAASNGGRVLLRGGSHPGPITIDQPMTLQAVGGVARIGF